MYCFMMMTTSKPGKPGHFEPTGIGTARSFEMKILEADTESQLLGAFLDQAESWLLNHPDREALGIKDYTPESVLRLPKQVQYEDDGIEYELPDVFHYQYKVPAPEGYSCVISSYDCWGYSFWELRSSIREANVFPYSPSHFDSTAIESADAWNKIHGDEADDENYWNRSGWKIRYNFSETDNFIEEMNAELAKIAHDPYLDGSSLKYFAEEH